MDIEDLYAVLEIPKTASKNEIRSAYKKMAKIWHPDKLETNNKVNSDKFIKIKAAYDILIDDDAKMKYDNMTYNEKNNFYESLMKLLEKYSPSAHNYVKNWLFLVYNGNYYENDFNSYRFDKFIEKIIFKNQESLKEINNLDIKQEITCNLIDRYLDNYIYVKINRNTRDPIFKHIPLRNDINIFENDGEIINSKNICGNLIIYVNVMNYKGFKIRNSDLFKKIKIPKNNNNNITIHHIDNTQIVINKCDLVDGKYIILKGKGLPRQDCINEQYERGDFLIEFINN